MGHIFFRPQCTITVRMLSFQWVLCCFQPQCDPATICVCTRTYRHHTRTPLCWYTLYRPGSGARDQGQWRVRGQHSRPVTCYSGLDSTLGVILERDIHFLIHIPPGQVASEIKYDKVLTDLWKMIIPRKKSALVFKISSIRPHETQSDTRWFNLCKYICVIGRPWNSILGGKFDYRIIWHSAFHNLFPRSQKAMPIQADALHESDWLIHCHWELGGWTRELDDFQHADGEWQ